MPLEDHPELFYLDPQVQVDQHKLVLLPKDMV